MPMNGKNRLLLANEPIEVQDFKKLPIILEESMEYTSNYQKEHTERWQLVTGWIWKH
jgi:hypothetical protein